MLPTSKTPSWLLLGIAYALVYLVWGSTYFFIQKVIMHLPVLVTGTIRFYISGFIMLCICLLRREHPFQWQQIKTGAVTGFFLLFMANGSVMVAELTIPSSFVAVFSASSPLLFVLMDKPLWRTNFTNKSTILGIIFGFLGVLLLLSDRLNTNFSTDNQLLQIVGIALLLVGNCSWVGGSLFAKRQAKGSPWVNTTWQMFGAATAFLICSMFTNQWQTVQFSHVPTDIWISLSYLIIFGSILAYSAYVWLLKVQPATKVSTYAYINPVVAVVLGYFWGKEHVSNWQIIGLGIILCSVLLINLAKYRKKTVR